MQVRNAICTKLDSQLRLSYIIKRLETAVAADCEVTNLLAIKCEQGKWSTWTGIRKNARGCAQIPLSCCVCHKLMQQ